MLLVDFTAGGSRNNASRSTIHILPLHLEISLLTFILDPLEIGNP